MGLERGLVDKLQRTGQISSAVCFCIAGNLRMVFTVLNGWKKIKRIIIFHNVKITGNSHFSFFWNTAIPTHFFLSVDVSMIQRES